MVTSMWTFNLLAAPLPTAPSHPFETENWNLAWQAFIGAGAINDAYVLAQSAVKARPDSRLWLTRLTQAARWSNHPQAALNALFRLAIHLHEQRYLQPALDLAIGLGDNAQSAVLLRKIIRLGRATPAQQHLLIGLYLNLGDPDRALTELQREFTHHPNRELLWRQAVIYRLIGEPQRELAVLQHYRKRFGPEPRVMLAIATSNYLQGRLQAALAALLTAESRARPGDTAYWRTLSGLAWQLGRYPLSAQAATVLFDTGKANRTIYQRLAYIEQYRHPKRAFAIAARGWQQTHDPTLFLSLLGIASAQHPVQPWLHRAFSLLNATQAKVFANEPLYWTSLATLHGDEGHPRQALAAYHQALRLSPNDNALLAGYLWLLLDTGNLAPVQAELGRITHRARNAVLLWAPLAAVYARLDQPQHALPWLQKQWLGHKNNPLWLINYADTLNQADQVDFAWRLRRRAYALLARQITKAANPKTTLLRRRELTRLATTLTPGDPARQHIKQLSRHPNSLQARVVVLSWMLDRRAYPLARWWRLRAFLRHPPPAWAQLSQAMAEDDGPTIARLLKRQRKRLPRRDRVDAAQRLGWNPLALSLAWQGLAGEPDDERLQRQFRELAVPRADSLGVTPEVIDVGGLSSIGANLDAHHWISPRDRLDLRLDTFRQRSTDATQLGTPPALRRLLQLNWQHRIIRGHLEFRLGAGRNLASWILLGLDWQQRWNRRFTTTLNATYGARPTDTVALELAGREDRVRAETSYQFTPRNNLLLQVVAGRLRAQGGGALGNVQRFLLAASHKFWLAQPDFSLRVSLSGAHYTHATVFPRQLAPLMPAGQTPAVSFFIPASFVQSCIGGHFNLQYETGYSGHWYPYASSNLCFNSVSGIGYDLSAGVGLPVLGPDHLSLSINLDDNVGTQAGRSTRVVLRYRYYFAPH